MISHRFGHRSAGPACHAEGDITNLRQRKLHKPGELRLACGLPAPPHLAAGVDTAAPKMHAVLDVMQHRPELAQNINLAITKPNDPR